MQAASTSPVHKRVLALAVLCLGLAGGHATAAGWRLDATLTLSPGEAPLIDRLSYTGAYRFVANEQTLAAFAPATTLQQPELAATQAASALAEEPALPKPLPAVAVIGVPRETEVQTRAIVIEPPTAFTATPTTPETASVPASAAVSPDPEPSQPVLVPATAPAATASITSTPAPLAAPMPPEQDDADRAAETEVQTRAIVIEPPTAFTVRPAAPETASVPTPAAVSPDPEPNQPILVPATAPAATASITSTPAPLAAPMPPEQDDADRAASVRALIDDPLLAATTLPSDVPAAPLVPAVATIAAPPATTSTTAPLAPVVAAPAATAQPPFAAAKPAKGEDEDDGEVEVKPQPKQRRVASRPIRTSKPASKPKPRSTTRSSAASASNPLQAPRWARGAFTPG